MAGNERDSLTQEQKLNWDRAVKEYEDIQEANVQSRVFLCAA
jgi:hypothetical protein